MSVTWNLKNIGNIEKDGVPCSDLCELYYNFGKSSRCFIRHRSKYLEISSGSNAISGNFEFKSVGELNVKKIRLYSPSINKYDNGNGVGEQKAAEILIHAYGNGTNVIFCMPITSTTSTNNTIISWISNWIDLPPTNNQLKEYSINNFSLNNLIPRSSYAIKDGANIFVTDVKSKNIFFTKPLIVLTSQIEKLRRIINDPGISIWTEIPGDKNVSFNKVGTTFGAGKLKKGAQTIQCTPIFDDGGGAIPGDDIDPTADPIEANKAAAAAAAKAGGWMDKWNNIDPTVRGIIIAVILILFLGWIFGKYGWPIIQPMLAARAAKKAADATTVGGGKSRRRRRSRKSRKR
jgi:hypothetical protein